MLHAFFNPSTAFGWALSIGGSALILFLTWRLMLQVRKADPKSVNEALLTKFDELHAAILAGEVTEPVFLAWVEHVPRRHPLDRSPAETSALTSSRTGLQEVMRHHNWKRSTISALINQFWRITVEDLDILLPAKR